MKVIIQIIIILLFSIGASTVSANNRLKLQSPAPDFTLLDQDKKAQTLSKMQGKWVILYFYPKDETSGCVAEACSFRDNIAALKAKNTVVWGVSVDNPDSHAQFAKNHQLPFTLLADPAGSIAKRYGSLRNLLFFKVAKRHSFIIDPQGKIAKIYRKVSPQSHIAEILADLKKLQN